MKTIEKFRPDAHRLIVFKAGYFLLILTLLVFMSYRQIFETDEYENKERKQGQRRIIRPGARGDVFDRNGNLLIGNRANFDAVLHVEALKEEIWKKKLELKKLAYQIRNDLSEKTSISLMQFINKGYEYEFVKNRKISIFGKSNYLNQNKKPEIYWGRERLELEIKKNGSWICELPITDFHAEKFIFLNTEPEIEVKLAGIVNLKFHLNKSGQPLDVEKQDRESSNFLKKIYSNIAEKKPSYHFFTSGYSLNWEARMAVVEKYIEIINKATGRERNIDISEVKNHWNRELVMPMELANGLVPREYAILVETLPTDSPIQVQARPVRHYPQKSLAAHILGYVGSGYEPDPKNLSGADLATFEIKGRKGKAGIEKAFDEILRGTDGGDIWRVNPMGYRFERIEKKPSKKGSPIELSIDLDLQKVAENSLSKMVNKVSKNRILPDTDWRKTIERRTKKALQGTHETDVPADLLISAFVDAPFPLNGKQAATVAGFKGTARDAENLLRKLYSEGVLAKPNPNLEEYVLAPPMMPPAAAVLLDLKTEEILVLANIPSYNLQELSPIISQTTYDKIQRMEAWLPRAYHPGYAPASPFKLVTALAGLRNQVIEPEEHLLCEGIYRGMECHVFPGRHGELNLRDAISQSCNVYFFRCAERIGHKKLISEARNLGFENSPHLELPPLRDSPIVPDPAWKKNMLGVKWTLEDTFNISIGQGGLRQSPLQMACFAGMLANKVSSFHPTIIKKDENEKTAKGSLEINATQYEAIIDGMHFATTRGTARRCNIEGISIAGKTGTGQWRNRNMELNLAWFIGFAPIENPAVAVAVLVEGVIPQDQIQGGLTATPIARDILAAYFSKLDHSLASSKNN